MTYRTRQCFRFDSLSEVRNNISVNGVMVMRDINACYKIIFEAMSNDKALSNIAKQIYGYAKCGIAFMTVAGRIMAEAGFSEEKLHSFRFVEKSHMSWEDYELFFVKKEIGKCILYTQPVYDKKQITGYVLFSYSNKEDRIFVEELGNFLAQICSKYFAKVQEKYIYNQSIRRHIRSWMIMEDEKECEMIRVREGKYVAALFLKSENVISNLSSFLRENCGSSYVYENEEEIRLLFYKLTNGTADRLYKRMEEKQIRGCVSDPFSDRHLYRAKQHLLNQISQTGNIHPDGNIKRENEWFIPGVYSYAVPLIEEAGLTDYSVQRLIREDEEKNTDLYHTLKTYLLCENNITMAAKKLHIHRNTLVYRLKQIENCLGFDLNDNESSWDLLAFIMMYDMVQQKRGEK